MNDLDELMSRLEADPLNATDADIDRLIAHYRERRASTEAGIKPKGKRTLSLDDKPKKSLTDLGLAKPVEAFKRRV